jgi:hypothetical protein
MSAVHQMASPFVGSPFDEYNNFELGSFALNHVATAIFSDQEASNRVGESLYCRQASTFNTSNQTRLERSNEGAFHARAQMNIP